MPVPHYPSVIPAALRTITARITRQQRSFRADSQRLCARVTPPIHYIGLENIPQQGPLLLTTNHYNRAGFSTAWISASISAVFPGEVNWIMSDEWLFQGNPFAFMLRPLMRQILASINYAYAFFSMPTMIAGYSTPQQRSSAVRQIIERLRTRPDSVIGISPEGMDSPQGSLGQPPSGAGKFMLYLQQMGMPILPAGVREADGQLHVHFGAPYTLTVDPAMTPNQADLWVSQTVMARIAPLIQ